MKKFDLAYCKYCYTTHGDWEPFDNEAWRCGRCEHGTQDDNLETITFKPFHDVANIFPMMGDEEFADLKEDIAENGLLEPIWLHQDGSVIDGRNRYTACMEVGVEPEYRTWDGKGSLVSFVVSLNLKRRMLTAMQKAVVGEEVEAQLSVEAKERQVRTTENREKAIEKRLVVEFFPQQDAQPSPTDFERFQATIQEKKKAKQQENKSREQAAKIVGTNSRYISDVKRYKEEAPDVYTAAKAGTVNGSQAKVLANLEPPKQKEYIEKIKAVPMSANEIKKQVKRETQKERRKQIAVELEEPTKEIPKLDTLPRIYRVIYADPPWQYGNDQTQAMPGSTRPDDHYTPMSTPDICALAVKQITIDNSVLFMWTTTAHLQEAFDVVKAWGFRYKTHVVWDKESHNYGPYTSVQHEILMICTKGACTPEKSGSIPSVVRIRKTEHSKKPEEFRDIIQKMYPFGQKIELFARESVDGWDTWGNQA